MKQSKPIWASRTFWVNVLSLAVVVISTVTGWEYLDGQASAFMLAAVNVINVILRVLTGEPVTLFPKLELYEKED